MNWRLVVPSMKVSGGIRETLRLGGQLAAQGAAVAVVALWRAENPVTTTLPVHLLSRWQAMPSRVLAQWPFLALRFARWMAHPALSEGSRFLFTHYTTLPLSVFVPRGRRYFFVQDLEWKFVRNRLLSALLRRVILFLYRRGNLVSANAYLTGSLQQLGLTPVLEAPIWADAAYLTDEECPRDIDFVMMLRKGAHKRLQDYHSFISLARQCSSERLKVAVVSPDDDLIAAVRDLVDVCLLRPSLAQMRTLYQRTKCFVHLSEHEGFGLPPLEAMGAGCIPLCRDSGGVRAFMLDELSALLMSPEAGVTDIFQRGCMLLADETQLSRYSRAARNVFRRGALASADTVACIQPLLS